MTGETDRHLTPDKSGYQELRSGPHHYRPCPPGLLQSRQGGDGVEASRQVQPTAVKWVVSSRLASSPHEYGWRTLHEYRLPIIETLDIAWRVGSMELQQRQSLKEAW